MIKNPCYDKKGIPIRLGDILKVFHFVGARKKRHYMYKMAWEYTWTTDDAINGLQKHSRLMGCHLGTEVVNGVSVENSYVLPSGKLEDYEIVQGYNNEGDELDFNDRPRMNI